MMAVVIRAYTNIKSGRDVTSAAYTIKGVLDTARTYAKANNTYVWVGFYEENVSQPSPNSATPRVGRLVMSIVASNDGTIIYNSSSPGTIDPTRLLQVGKLTKIDNVHLATNLAPGSGTYPGSTCDTRPTGASTYRIGDTANSTTPFQYPVGNPAPAAQYTFVKAVQFSPGGEARVNNSTNTLQTAAEIGLEPTHGDVAPSSIPADVLTIQCTCTRATSTPYLPY